MQRTLLMGIALLACVMPKIQAAEQKLCAADEAAKRYAQMGISFTGRQCALLRSAQQFFPSHLSHEAQTEILVGLGKQLTVRPLEFVPPMAPGVERRSSSADPKGKKGLYPLTITHGFAKKEWHRLQKSPSSRN